MDLMVGTPPPPGVPTDRRAKRSLRRRSPRRGHAPEGGRATQVSSPSPCRANERSGVLTASWIVRKKPPIRTNGADVACMIMLAMPSHRIQRRIDSALDEAEAALDERDWATVHERARFVLTLDPQNEDAVELRDAAERGLGDGPGAPPATTSAPDRVREHVSRTVIRE